MRFRADIGAAGIAVVAAGIAVVATDAAVAVRGVTGGAGCERIGDKLADEAGAGRVSVRGSGPLSGGGTPEGTGLLSAADSNARAGFGCTSEGFDEGAGVGVGWEASGTAAAAGEGRTALNVPCTTNSAEAGLADAEDADAEDNEAAGTEAAGTEAAGTEAAGTEAAGTVTAGVGADAGRSVA